MALLMMRRIGNLEERDTLFKLWQKTQMEIQYAKKNHLANTDKIDKAYWRGRIDSAQKFAGILNELTDQSPINASPVPRKDEKTGDKGVECFNCGNTMGTSDGNDYHCPTCDIWKCGGK